MILEKSTLRPAVLITAGPTREAIDPVRYLTNHSSGKMGFAVAEAFLDKGFKVILVSGPVSLRLEHPCLQLVRVISAEEMFNVCKAWFDKIDIAVFAAAVADHRPAVIHAEKLKKNENVFDLRMVKTIDIAKAFGKVKSAGQFSVGFALESENEALNASKKLREKNFDLIVLNSIRDEDAGFGYDTNKITIINKNLEMIAYPLKSKKLLGADIASAAIAQHDHIS